MAALNVLSEVHHAAHNVFGLGLTCAGLWLRSSITVVCHVGASVFHFGCGSEYV
jgi:hypothetical protein